MEAFLTKLGRRLPPYSRQLWQGIIVDLRGPLWGGLGVVGALLLLMIAAGDFSGLPERVRFLGVFLQIAGVLTIAFDLAGRLAKEKDKTLGGVFVDWYRRTFQRKRSVNLPIGGVRHQKQVSPANTPACAAEDATLEERVNVIERELRVSQSRIQQLDREITQERVAREKGDKAESAARERDMREVRNRFADVQLGNFHLEWASVVWLVAGLLLAGFPETSADIVM